MILGHVRDNLPYITLALPGNDGRINIEFLIDTGFDGFLSLPASVIRQLHTSYSSNQVVRTADGAESKRRTHEIEIEWADDRKITYIIELDGGTPLLGVELLADNLVTIAMTDGGEISIEPL